MPHDAHTLALTLHLCDDGLQALNDVLVRLASRVPVRPGVDTSVEQRCGSRLIHESMRKSVLSYSGLAMATHVILKDMK